MAAATVVLATAVVAAATVAAAAGELRRDRGSEQLEYLILGRGRPPLGIFAR